MKYILLALALCATTLHAQTTLEWKVKPGEEVRYKTIMEEVDTSDVDFDFEGFSKKMANVIGKDSITVPKDFGKEFKSFAKMFESIKIVTTVKNGNKNNTILVEMQTVDESINTADLAAKGGDEMASFMKQMLKGNMLRGTLYTNGTIESFYTKKEQKNLVAILFELPGKPVKIGDKWALTTSLISMDNNFLCDTSYRKNEVTLVRLDKVEGETIAVLRYDIEEYVNGVFSHPILGEDSPSMMRMTVDVTAGFAIEKGRWQYYDGYMNLESTGFIKSKTKKRISLLPM